MIPTIIHQVWHRIREPSAIPAELAPLPGTWRRHHPGWDYRLWTNEDSRRFVAAHYPDLLPVYDSYGYAIQRADAIRYCVLHRFGGVYVDMDIECLRPIDGLLDGHAMVLTREPQVHARYLGLDTLLSNAFMAARPGHPFLAEIVEDLVRHPRPAALPRDVFASTGPRMLTRLHERRSRPDVHITDHRAISPFAASAPGLHHIRAADENALQHKLACIADGAYAVHYWANTWSPALEDLVNPTPHGVAGFVFFQGVDSAGFDIRQETRNIGTLAHACARRDDAVAFNTDGYIKSRVRPKWRWRRSGDRQANEGLYVKETVLAKPWWRVIGAGRRLKPDAIRPAKTVTGAEPHPAPAKARR
jgi:hypothetical protein